MEKEDQNLSPTNYNSKKVSKDSMEHLKSTVVEE